MEYEVHITDGIAMDDGSGGNLPTPPTPEAVIPQAMEVTHEEIVFFEELLKTIVEKKDD